MRRENITFLTCLKLQNYGSDLSLCFTFGRCLSKEVVLNADTAWLLLLRQDFVLGSRLATALGYYGLSLNAAAFGGNKYLNFFISGAVEFPAYLSGVFILPK